MSKSSKLRASAYRTHQMRSAKLKLNKQLGDLIKLVAKKYGASEFDACLLVSKLLNDVTTQVVLPKAKAAGPEFASNSNNPATTCTDVLDKKSGFTRWADK